ncbi:MAG: CHRD domain-containing protein [Acidobacteriota bacterium]
MLKKCLKLCLLLTLVCVLPSIAQTQNLRGLGGEKFTATLIGYEEVPALSTTGFGTFSLTIDPSDTFFDYQVSYSSFVGNVTQSHIHIAQKGVNGGIMVFFCTNLGNGPPGTQLCPGPTSGSVSGRITAANVGAGAAAQGIAAGEFAEVLAAIRAGTVYANVHSTVFPGGEIRGQLLPDISPKL